MVNFLSGDMLKQFQEAIEWLQEHKLNAVASRYGRYLDYIDSFYSAEDPTNADGREKFELLTKSLQECLELVLVKNTFHDEKSSGFKSTLSKVVSGDDHLEHAQASEPRNFMFELLVAARFKQAGYTIDFDSNTDIIARKNEQTFYIECKRIVSERGYEANLKKAYEQLQKRMPPKKSDSTLGLIFVDILPFVSKHIPKFEVECLQVAGMLTNNIMNDYKKKISRHTGKRLEKERKYCQAVCLTASFPVWLGDGTLYRYDQLSATLPEKLTNKVSDNVVNVLKNIQNTLESGIET